MSRSIQMAGEGKLNLPTEGIPEILSPQKTFELFVNIEKRSLQTLFDIFSEYIRSGKPINQMDPELGMKLAPTMIKSLSEEDGAALGLADREYHVNAYYNLAFETYIKANTHGFMSSLRTLEGSIQSISRSLMSGTMRIEDLEQVQKNIENFGKKQVEEYLAKFRPAPVEPVKEVPEEEENPVEEAPVEQAPVEEAQVETPAPEQPQEETIVENEENQNGGNQDQVEAGDNVIVEAGEGETQEEANPVEGDIQEDDKGENDQE